mgnify:CR=1 FL=1
MNNTYGYSSFNPNYYNMNSQNVKTNADDRLIGGGFAFPFLLGGVTGAAIAPAFWRPAYNRPFYGPYYGPGPYYMPYRPF